MSSSVYHPLDLIFFGGALIALALAAVYLVAIIAGWRGPQRKRRLWALAAFLAAAPALIAAHQALLYFVFRPSLGREATRQRQARGDEASFVRAGDEAPSFSVTDTNGGEFVLDDLRGKVVLVNFFATWCGPCLLELPHLQRLWNENRANDDFALIVIGRDETAATVIEFTSNHGYTFPAAPDPEGSIYSLFAEELIPRTYLVARNGNICFNSTGYSELDMETLEAELSKQLRSPR